MARRLCRMLLGPERGATAVEYALMLSLIALVIIGSVIVLGTNLSAFFADAATKV